MKLSIKIYFYIIFSLLFKDNWQDHMSIYVIDLLRLEQWHEPCIQMILIINIFLEYSTVAHAGELFGFDSLITMLPDMELGVYTCFNGPGGEAAHVGNQLMHYYIIDQVSYDSWMEIFYKGYLYYISYIILCEGIILRYNTMQFY